MPEVRESTTTTTTTTTDVANGPNVVVVGGGLAGVCAAIAATEHGAAVVVLDGAHGGGSSAISGGVIYAGGGTRQQLEAAAAAEYGGHSVDTPDNMFRYLRQEISDDSVMSEATLRRFCDESVARVEWLERHGVVFGGALCPFRTSYPTDKYSLYFSGNEKAHPYATVADPAPRGHRVVGKGGGGMNMTGNVLWRTLYDAAVRMGVRFEFASKVEQLLSDATTNAVVGVRYRSMDQTSAVFAKHKIFTENGAYYHQLSVGFLANWYDRRAHNLWRQHTVEKTLRAGAIILAAGGFGMNEGLMKKYVPFHDKVSPLGTSGDDGSGIKLGLSVGGTVSHMDRLSAWRLMYPPEGLVEGIVVSPKGERIAAEDTYGASLSNFMMSSADGRGYLILDSRQWKKVNDQIPEQTQMPWRAFIYYIVYWAHWKATSVHDLARKTGIDAIALDNTISAHNEAIAAGKPDPVNKLGWRCTISESPFYAIDISLTRSGMLVVPALPLGGLTVKEESGLLLDEKGMTIRGVYAAGKTAMGICSNNYVSGLALADCVFSGKRAGEHAASVTLTQ